MSKFYIGQKVVAIRDHQYGDFKKGAEFTVLSKNSCRCCEVNVVGVVRNTEPIIQVCACGYELFQINGFREYREMYFSPIELSSTTFEDIVNLKQTI